MVKLYFVGGASGSGKTAILNKLQKLLDNGIKVYDFDDIGVPENADKKWRQKSTEEWLNRLISEEKNALLLGQIVLGEILACPSSEKLGKIDFCFLDVSDFERIKRLKNRKFGADQNMLNWASWLRMHHQDPQWLQHVLKEDCWSDLDFSSWDKIKNWSGKVNIRIFDTTGLSVEKVASTVYLWTKNA